MFATLISAADLHRHLGEFVIVDCRADLMRPEAGREAYLAGHVPGAVFAHLEDDLSGPKTAFTGRHPLPDPQVLADKLGGFGIGAGTQVVAYDAENGMYASHLWWLLRWLGHRAVAVLDGGLKGWFQAGFAQSKDVPRPKASLFRPNIDRSLVVSADEVGALVRQDSWRVLDARAPERFRGDIEPIDPVAGHIPGARNHPFATNLGASGNFLSSDQLRQKFVASLGGVAADHSVAMCGSGVTACHNLLAMEIAGLTGAKLYAGSWSEWIRDRTRPTSKGDPSDSLSRGSPENQKV